MKKTILTLISPRITPGSTTCSLLRTFSPHDRAVARGGDGQVQAGDLDALAAVVLSFRKRNSGSEKTETETAGLIRVSFLYRDIPQGL